ncbi:MAG: DNA topoisomerase (ATP-hydrolyzing) subunit A [Chloroflexi bacterium]|nr:DNA topoisomerase (ATP-hydrolyzing) subunit A [Chloroflexota bacterium]
MSDSSIHQVTIESEMRDAYLSYAMSVIVSRALPDARDGLKPVHRRILYAMHDMGIGAGGTHKKSARIVGEVMGKYHPHGDAAVYDTMVRMAQDFSMRYMLIDGQGNFGSIDGDGAAAMRYTEARMASVGSELLVDIHKDTVDFADNFDGTLDEPTVLPASLPNLLVNGASGIAVGMSTNIPPHNLGEVCDALCHLLDQWQRLDEIDVDELMRFVKGPDFPTGGVIYGRRGKDDMLRQALATGRGKITLRAKLHVEDMGGGKSRIIISELPYQVNKTTLIERIAMLVNANRLKGLADLRDESDRQNAVRLVIELQRNVDVTAVLARLFKLTPLQSTFGIIMLALVDGQPRLLTLKQALRVYLQHRLEVLQRSSHFDLARAQERAHILEGLLIALDELDAVIAAIRKSRSSETARRNLIKQFKVSETQASAILDMALRRLAALERRKLRDEYKATRQHIKQLQTLLENPQRQRAHIAESLTAVKERYGDPRRSIIADGEASALSQADFLVPEAATVVMLSASGHLGRTHKAEPPSVTTRTKHPPRWLQHSSTSQITYLFADDGDCATVPVQQIPQVKSAGEGMQVSDLCALQPAQRIVSFLCLPASLSDGNICLVTARGQAKRLKVSELPGLMSTAFSVMKLARGDKLVAALYSRGDDELLLASARGYAIRFSEADVRTTSLAAGGVRGIKLVAQDDRVVSAFVADDKLYAWNITERGIAKTTPMREYKTQGRGGSGVLSMRLPLGSKRLAAATIGRLDDTALVLTNKRKAKYMSLGLAKTLKRGSAGGNEVIALRDKETVVGVARYHHRIDFRINNPEPPQQVPATRPGASSENGTDASLAQAD